MTKQNEKDAKRVPELRFKGFTDDWEQRKLGEIATIVGGGTPSTKNPEYWDGDINWYSPAEIGNQIYTEKSERQITELGLKKSSAKLLPVGTVLFTSRAGIGKTAILNKEACTNQGFQSIIPRSKMLNSYFLFSRTNSLKQYGETMGSGSTFVEVSGKQMSKMPLFIPNINEQSKIAKLFQSLDKTITLHEEKQRQLERLKKALLQKMFADETGYPVLRFKGFTNTWEQRKLGALASFSKGSGYSKKDLTSEGIPVILYGRLYTDYETIIKSIDTFSQKKKSSVYSTGRDVIVPASGETAEDIARASVVSKKGVALGSDLNIITPTKNIDPTFLALSISNGTPHKEMAKRAQGKSIVHLHNADLVQIMLKYPSLREQKKVSQQFEKLDYLITLHQHKIDNLKRLKRALLQKMFV